MEKLKFPIRYPPTKDIKIAGGKDLNLNQAGGCSFVDWEFEKENVEDFRDIFKP
jgi:hypothetical protein